MGDKTKIEWADATWNPVTGCTKVSPGCAHCYIDRTPPFRMAGRRFEIECPECDGSGVCVGCRNGDDCNTAGCCPTCDGLGGVPSNEIGATTGVLLHPERLDQPLRWKRPRRVFVNSLSDLFHDDVPDDYIARVFAVMASNYQWERPTHVFQVLTKRPARMRAMLSSDAFRREVASLAGGMTDEGHADAVHDAIAVHHWPLPNVWLGVTVEDQKRADLRVPILLDTPAAVRFLSVEPMLGPVDLSDFVDRWSDDDTPTCDWGYCDSPAVASRRDFTHPHRGYISMLSVCERHRGIDWVICGGESGPGARPMHTRWARDLRDQCVAAGVPFHFKQWGEWARTGRLGAGTFDDPREALGSVVDDGRYPSVVWREVLRRTGKREAGRELDGRTWDEYPSAAPE